MPVLKHISSGHLDSWYLKYTKDIVVYTICINQVNFNIQFTWCFLYISIVGKTLQTKMLKWHQLLNMIEFQYHISSNKQPQYLSNFEILKCDAY